MSDLAKAFAGLKQAHEPETPRAKLRRELTGSLELLGTPTHSVGAPPESGPKLVRLSLGNTAKSRHPEFTPVKVFLRRETHKAAGRKWEDEDAGDFSDLVERLLLEYLGA
jgi:hypothetical protein